MLQSDAFHVFATICGWAAAAASFYAFHSKTMIPLRVAIIAANALSIVWGLHTMNLPNLVLNIGLLPLNILRLREMRKLVDDVKAANREPIDYEWLKPYMREVVFPAGATIFSKDDAADSAYVIGEGQVALPELGVILGPGSLMGEMGLFTAGNKRMSGARCMSEVRTWRITYAEFEQLYFQNPQFGFHIVRLMVRRMENNLARFSAPRPPTAGGTAAPHAP
ncbi:MAG: Crp/Fnr family transcriptional regulator [Beijerinckiaceae bacterium]